VTLLAFNNNDRGALVADMARYYGHTPAQLAAGGVPLSDVAAMAAHLPRDSESMMALYPPTEFDFWYDPVFGGGVNTQLLAGSLDRLTAANWQRGGGKSARPQPLKRPKPPTVATGGFDSVDEFRNWYARQTGGRPTTNTT